MPVPFLPSQHAFATVAGAWTELFTDAKHGHRSGATIRAVDGSTEGVLVLVRATGDPIPNGDIPITRAMYGPIFDPYPLGEFADYRTRIYVRGAADGVVNGLAWEVVGK